MTCCIFILLEPAPHVLQYDVVLCYVGFAGGFLSFFLFFFRFWKDNMWRNSCHISVHFLPGHYSSFLSLLSDPVSLFISHFALFLTSLIIWCGLRNRFHTCSLSPLALTRRHLTLKVLYANLFAALCNSLVCFQFRYSFFQCTCVGQWPRSLMISVLLLDWPRVVWNQILIVS